MRGSKARQAIIGALSVAIVVTALALIVAVRNRNGDEAATPSTATAVGSSTVPTLSSTVADQVATTLGAAGDVSFVGEVVAADDAGDCKAFGDLDGDGADDGIVGGARLTWYSFSGDTPAAHQISAAAASEYSTDCQLGDVDGDGDLDLVVPDERRLLWFANPAPGGDPAGGPWPSREIGTTESWTHDVVLAELDGDGRLDVVTRRQGSTDLWLQRSPGAWERRTVSQQGGEGTAVGDLDGDGDADIVAGATWLEHPGGRLDQDQEQDQDWEAHPLGAVAAGPIPVEDLHWGSVAIADMDGDGRLDVIYGPMEQTGTKLAWYRATDEAAKVWTEHLISPEPIATGMHTLQVADMNADGRLDVITARMHTVEPHTVSVWINEGDATSWRESVVSEEGLHNLRVGDGDGDGDLDIFGSNYIGNPPVRLFRNALA